MLYALTFSVRSRKEKPLQYGKQWKLDLSPIFSKGEAGRRGHYDVGEEGDKRRLKSGSEL